MTYALISAVVLDPLLIVGAFIFYLKGRDDAQRAERLHTYQVIQDLCQRIQAPEVATAMHARTVAAPSPGFVGIEDDKGYWDEVQRLKDQASELQVSANGAA